MPISKMYFKKHTIIDLLREQILKIINSQVFIHSFNNLDTNVHVNVEKSKFTQFGDYCTNIAIILSKDKEQQLLIASVILKLLPKKYIEHAEIANNGFINLFLNQHFLTKSVHQVMKQKEKYGTFPKKHIFYNLEFVSANPTGLLHIGHARNAAFGDSLSRIWKAYGINLNKEYYINDGGNQIKKLGLSLLVRYKQSLGLDVSLPEDSYKGEEIIEVSKHLINEIGDRYKDVQNDNEIIIAHESICVFFENYAKKHLLGIIKQTLKEFNVEFDIWFSESSLYKENSKLINGVINLIKPYVYKKDNALWLRTSQYDDDKDRVLIKSDGEYTYFTPDIVYHHIKLSRGYDKIFNIWGSDHKSYVDRLKIAMQMLGYKKEQVNVLIMQMIRLMDNGNEFKMSKRSGNSLTLVDLVQAIGINCARWYLVSQSLNTHLEIDVNKAKKQDNSNPIYYVQYVNARINQLLKKAKTTFKKIYYPLFLKNLILDEERELMSMLYLYKFTIESIANTYEVHKMTQYLFNLAKLFHAYYTKTQIINKNKPKISLERLSLCLAIQHVIKNGLGLLGIENVLQEM